MKKPLNILFVVIGCVVLEVLVSAASWLVLSASLPDWALLTCYAVIGAAALVPLLLLFIYIYKE